MEKQRNITLMGMIYVILIALYNLVAFLLFNEKGTVFWTSYGFMTVAFIIQIVSMLVAFYRENAKVETVFFGISLASLSLFYFFAELFCSLVFMFFPAVGFIPALLIQAILLGGFLIIAIIALMSRDVVEDMSAGLKEKVAFIRFIQGDLEVLAERTSDRELKAVLAKLAETVKYSDPITLPALAELEDRIMRRLSDLRTCCKAENLAAAQSACTDLNQLFVERNKKLMISK